jgi:hypothetical protein
MSASLKMTDDKFELLKISCRNLLYKLNLGLKDPSPNERRIVLENYLCSHSKMEIDILAKFAKDVFDVTVGVLKEEPSAVVRRLAMSADSILVDMTVRVKDRSEEGLRFTQSEFSSICGEIRGRLEKQVTKRK